MGYPELPLKGILVDIPEGRSASLTVLRTVTQLHDGYRVYPVPQRFADEQPDAAGVGERFVQDQTAYSLDGFYPGQVAQTGGSYLMRGRQKQQVLFYPLSFNPVTGQVRLHSRIRVRVDFVDSQLARAAGPGVSPWKPPLDQNRFDSLPPIGVMASIFGPAPAFVSPLLSALASFNSAVMAIWTPPISEAAGHRAYKLSLSEEGIYRIDQTWLINNGIDPADFDLSALRMYHLGEEIAINVHDANADDRFDAADYIEFYGAPVTAAYAKYSTDTVYWLTTGGGSGQPRRMGTIDGTPAFGPLAGTHGFTYRYELDQTYLQSAPGPDSRDRWIFSTIARGSEINHAAAGLPVDFTFTLPDVAGSAGDTLTISMIGAYDTDHEVDVALNGSYVGTYYWSGIGFYDALIEGVDFVDGDNTVSVTCVTGLDKIAFDWFEASYQRDFKAVNNYLRFNHATGYEYQLEQFATDTLMAFDVTDQFNVQQVTNFTVSGSNPYTLAFELPPGSGSAHTYIATAADLVKTPTAISADAPSDLADTANGADYILINHQELGWDGGGQALGWLDDLVALRQSQGLRVKVAKITDIFDEFSYGVVTPAAIRDFLAYAYASWTPPAPQYVLLVGDASYDYKNNWNLATTVNHVPSYLTYTQYLGETVTDEWFVRISGEDAAADMYIGRLPAVDADQAAVMVEKILAYEAADSSKLWGKDILLVADNQAEEWESVFETMNEDAAALVPADMNSPSRGYLQDYEDQGFAVSDLTDDLTAAINTGALMVNYSGHGALGLWADEAIFDNSNGWPRYRQDVDNLTNDGLYPLFVSMSCLTGYFAYPEAWSQMYNYNYFSLGESLLRAANAGAAAAFMPTGMTSTDGQHILNRALFASLFTEDIRQLGPAIAHAKLTLLANGDAYNEEVSATFLLLGDPAMTLKVPLPERPAGLTAAQTEHNVVSLIWQPALDADGNAVAGYHVYRSVSASGGYARINAELVTGNGFEDQTVAAGTRYYYTVTSVDASLDQDQSVMSQPVSVVPAAPVSSLAGSGSGGGGGGGGGCFISTSQEAFNQDIMNGLAFLGVVVILWRLIMRIKARARGAGRQSSTHRDENSVFDETTDLGFQVMTEQGNLVVTGTDDRAGKEKQASDLPEEPLAVASNSTFHSLKPFPLTGEGLGGGDHPPLDPLPSREGK